MLIKKIVYVACQKGADAAVNDVRSLREVALKLLCPYSAIHDYGGLHNSLLSLLQENRNIIRSVLKLFDRATRFNLALLKINIAQSLFKALFKN